MSLGFKLINEKNYLILKTKNGILMIKKMYSKQKNIFKINIKIIMF